MTVGIDTDNVINSEGDSAEEQGTEVTKRGFNPARSTVKLIATSSVRFVVSGAITTLVPVETKKEKRKVFVASMVLSGMINEQVKPYVDREIDDAIDFCKTVIDQVKKQQQKAYEQAAAEAAESDVPNP